MSKFSATISSNFQNFSHLHTFVQSQKPFIVKSLHLLKHGNPTDVLQIKEEKLVATNSNQVLIKILASPIHPLDVDYIRGVKPPACKFDTIFPIIPGRECVAEVISIGADVRELTEGQRVVIPFADTISKRGTWTTYALYDSDDLIPIPKDIGIPEAAILTISPCVAYRILKDFITLNPGDSILFDGGNSAIGQALHQLCRAWNLQSFSVVSSGSDKDSKHLQLLGATKTFTYDELLETKVFEDGTFPKPRLTLSCVTRPSSTIIGKFLDQKGVMIVYGCMAGYPTAMATASLIFKDFVQRPFWITRWSKNNPTTDERNCMFAELCNLIRKQEFRAPEMELVPFKEYKDAFGELDKLKGIISTQFLLDMQCEE